MARKYIWNSNSNQEEVDNCVAMVFISEIPLSNKLTTFSDVDAYICDDNIFPPRNFYVIEKK